LDGSTPLSHTYEIHLPMERTAVPDGRIVGDLATPKKTDVEIEGIKKYLGYK